jgi:dTDP-glucose 4,6-dehydratase
MEAEPKFELASNRNELRYWRRMKILVTGAAGFIGSNFVRYELGQYADVSVAALDSLTYAGNMENLAGLDGDKRFEFIKADISSPIDMGRVFGAHEFDAIVNFAAETHVDRSLMDASIFIQTNMFGVQNLLDQCRKRGVRRFLQVSTDEVYGSLGAEGKFSEDSPIQPNNPYAATKAAADLLVRAAYKSHGIEAVITRCSNNFGPYQFPEKLIPLMIANAVEDKQLPVYGDGMHVRDWIYVEDHCSAVDVVLRKSEPGKIYNIGGNHDVPNIHVVKTILKALDKPESLIRYVADRPGHDRRYAMDSLKLREELGWDTKHTFDTAIAATVRWYLDNRGWWERVRSGEYVKYYESLYGERLKSQ